MHDAAEFDPLATSEIVVRLTDETASIVSAQIAAGGYDTPEAVVADALTLLADEPEAAYWRQTYFRELIQHGVEQADRGELKKVEDVAAWLDGLGRSPPEA